jgi:flagellar hook-basal body complex protein FliE
VAVAPIAAAGVAPALPTLPTLPTAGPGPTPGAGDFGDMFMGALDDLSRTQAVADDLATQAATGELTDVHDYMIAATEASLATELTVAVRNKAVDAFNQIMNMQV